MNILELFLRDFKTTSRKCCKILEKEISSLAARNILIFSTIKQHHSIHDNDPPVQLGMPIFSEFLEIYVQQILWNLRDSQNTGKKFNSHFGLHIMILKKVAQDSWNALCSKNNWNYRFVNMKSNTVTNTC